MPHTSACISSTVILTTHWKLLLEEVGAMGGLSRLSAATVDDGRASYALSIGVRRLYSAGRLFHYKDSHAQEDTMKDPSGWERGRL